MFKDKSALLRALLKALKIEFSFELIAPITLLIFYIALLIFLRGSMPTSEEIFANITNLYRRFGYEVVFIGAFLEALLLVNLFVPGLIIVAFGAIFARAGEIDLTTVVVVAVLGAVLGYMIDFLLGKFGFGKIISKIGYGKILTQAKVHLEKSLVPTFVLGFVQPNIGSFIALAAGALKIQFRTFVLLSTLSTIVWASFWAVLIFALGEVFLIILTKYIWIVVLFVLSVWLLATLYSNRKN